jgi:putative two-component system response regulator
MIADDVPENVALLQRILSGAGFSNTLSTIDGSEVVPTFLRARPDIVLLDLHMPKVDGLETIRALRAHAQNGSWVPIIVLTGDSSVEARRSSLAAGASDFIGKPYDMTEVVLRVHNLLQTRRLQLALAEENESLEQRVRERTDQLFAARIDVLHRLAVATEKRDDDTGEHTRRVGILAAELAECLGAPAPLVDLIRKAAPLHDIGKIAIPDAILNKPGKLTADEFAVMKTHTTEGAGILAGGDHQLIHVAERIAATHHERWDGRGYPLGLSGEDIPLEGRITAVADFYDALVHKRVYRPAFQAPDVLRMIAEASGSQFDPAVAEAMLQLSRSR